MTRYLGRVVGVVVGAPAGIVGVGFGFLVGLLVDQFRSASLRTWRLERFLRTPTRERSRDVASAYAVAAAAAAVLTADGPARTVQVDRALAQPWPRAPRRRRGRGVVPVPRTLLDRCLVYRDRIVPARVGAFCARWPEEDRLSLVDLLVAVACADRRGMSPAERDVIREIVDAASVDDAVVADAEHSYGGLDGEACTLLGVTRHAEESDVRRAFRTMAAHLHPDTASALDQEQRRTMEEAFVRVRDAHDHLLAQLRARTGR